MSYTLIKPLNDYVFRPLYKTARKCGLSKRASLHVSHIPGALLETNFLWLVNPYLAAGVFLASELIIPEDIYRKHNQKRNGTEKEKSEGVLEGIISKEIAE